MEKNKFKKILLIIISFLLLIIFLSFNNFDNTIKDEIKITEINLFGQNYDIFFSKIYLSYIIILDHYYNCKWNKISNEFIIKIRNSFNYVNINYDIIEKNKDYLDFLYKGHYKKDYFFFNETIFNNFAIKMKMNLPIKNAFNDKNIEKSYDLLIRFYKSNYEIISNIVNEINQFLESYFIKYYIFNQDYNLNSLSLLGKKLKILPFFKSSDLNSLGFAEFDSISFAIGDNLYENYQIILHETAHIFYNENEIFNKIIEYNYLNQDEFLNYIKIFDESYAKLYSVNPIIDTNDKKQVISITLNVLYINFDEFFAYEFSKFYLEKIFPDFTGMSFADTQKLFFNESVYLQLKTLSKSEIIKTIFDSFIVEKDYKSYIKLFILYILTMVKGYDYASENYLKYFG